MKPLTALSLDDLVTELDALGEKPYRAKQILEWIYDKRVTDIAEMTNLSAALRARLAETHTCQSIHPAREADSSDTTRKFLFKLHDGRFIETVLIPASTSFDGSRSDRHTLCVSSQVGCAYDCKFCASGLAGFVRNLQANEIVEQVLQVEAISGKTINNIVYMGMGEPLANLTSVLKSIEIINAHWGLEIGARHITVSTSGLAPQIKKIADFPLQIRLAISLHGASDEVRSRIMPVNDTYNLDRLFESLEYHRSKKKQKITFEYILIEGVNDHLDQAKLLAKRAKPIHAKINLIPYNNVEGLPWKRPSEDQQEAFLEVLKNESVPATLRREKGHDINAACGQLRLREEATT